VGDGNVTALSLDGRSDLHAAAGGDPVNESDPSGLCPGSWYCGIEHAIGRAVTNTQHAWDCLNSACYTTRTGFANLVAGAHNTVNFIEGAPPVAEPYPCSNGDAFALGGQLPYWAVGVLVPGAGDVGAVDGIYFDDLPAAADGGATATADVAKFSGYAFVTNKAPIFESYGYTAADSQDLADLYVQQAAQRFADGDYRLGEFDQYGQRITIQIDLPGQGAATGLSTILDTGWMIEPDGSIRLLTPFAGFGK
jgi:filamentous hemagglutinin